MLKLFGLCFAFFIILNVSCLNHVIASNNVSYHAAISTSKYLPLINTTKINSIVVNSTQFKEAVGNLNFTYDETISRLQLQEKTGNFALGPFWINYLLYTGKNIVEKEIIVTMDSQYKITNVEDYIPDQIPSYYHIPMLSLDIEMTDLNSHKNIENLKIVLPPTPLDQVKSGIAPADVECISSVLVLRTNNGSPVCVSPDTAKILIERDWGHLILKA